MWKFFISSEVVLECVIISLIFTCCCCVVCLKLLGILQSCGYSNRRFLGWAARKGNLAQSRLTLLFMTMALSSAVLGLCFSFLGRWSAVIGLAGYVIFFVTYFFADVTMAFKVDASITPRFKRLYTALFCVFLILTYALVTTLNYIDSIWDNKIFTDLRYVPLALIPLCCILIVCLTNLITYIWEKPIAGHYIRQAKAKLAAADGLVTIGITGSYGKTSAKQILSVLLSKKYRVLSTPLSYNTPLGVAKTVNREGCENFDIFIAEMGARQRGDIAKLCKLCPPDYSLITGICPQHLQSFKTVENVVLTKGEIISATKNKCYISADCIDYFKNTKGDIVKPDCVSEVSATSSGTEFTLTLGGKTARVKTSLLGEHSAYTIGLCATIAYDLGVSAEDIARAISAIPYVEHRLQLMVTNGVNIIDDGYNSNIVGAKAAVEVLKSFEGNKVIVTPGIVELGVLEKSENELLGARLVGLDHIILVGETLVKSVYEGYKKAGGDEQKVQFAPSLTAAQDILKTIIKKGDCVLFLNDLPHQYM